MNAVHESEGKSMASKTKSNSGASKASAANTLTVTENEGKSQERMMAELGLSPIVANTNTVRKFGKGAFGELDLSESIDVMREKIDKVKAGNLSDVEATLTAQAVTLDAVFNELARRAALNMGEYMGACETYLRMALKAQAQCRATLETLAEVKYPKAATFVRQQNVAYQQQVNNGNATSGNKETSTHTPAHAHGKSLNQSIELLEAQHGERLDEGTAGTASGNDSHLEAVGTIDRPANAKRQAA